jgi:hypothetical protein
MRQSMSAFSTNEGVAIFVGSEMPIHELIHQGIRRMSPYPEMILDIGDVKKTRPLVAFLPITRFWTGRCAGFVAACISEAVRRPRKTI